MISVNGTVVSVSSDGKKAQLAVKAGAYRGTYHGTLHKEAEVLGVTYVAWLTIPDKKTADQIGIITTKETPK